MSSPSVTPGRQFPVFNRAVPLSWIVLLAILVHGPLLLMQIPNDSYDAYLHQFFAAHYAQHWFSPWNEKWFTGFSQTTYPPLEQQWIALFSHIMGLRLLPGLSGRTDFHHHGRAVVLERAPVFLRMVASRQAAIAMERPAADFRGGIRSPRDLAFCQRTFCRPRADQGFDGPPP